MLKILQEIRRPIRARIERIRAARDAAILGLILSAILVALETLGPTFRSEYGDVALAVVGMTGLLVAGLWVQTRQPGWTASARQCLIRFGAHRKLKTGIDFRPSLSAPLPHCKVPGILIAGLFALSFLSIGLVTTLGHIPHILYRFAPYSLYLAFTVSLWIMGLMVLFAGVLILYLQFRRLLKKLNVASRPTRAWLAVPLALGTLTTVLVLDWILDPVLAMSFLVACLFAPLALMTRPAPSNYVYTIKRVRDGQLTRMTHFSLMLSLCLGIALVAIPLFILLQGYRLPAAPGPLFPVHFTEFVGRGATGILLCLAPYLIATLLHTHLVRRFREDPCLPTKYFIQLSQDLKSPTAEEVLALRIHHIEVRNSENPWPKPDLYLYKSERPQHSEAPAYPMDVSWSDSELIPMLRRRITRAHRRAFLLQTERLFHSLGQARKGAGEGVYFAPHWWVMAGVNRDGDEGERQEDAFDLEHEDRECLGPTYQSIYGRSLRSYGRDVFMRCDIDIIFVQDGVRTEEFTAVIKRLIDHAESEYDLRPIEERDLVGFVGLSLHLQLVDFENDEKSPSLSGFAEPNYDDVSRARILLIFRDKGDESEREVQDDDSWLKDVLDDIRPKLSTH